MVSNNDNSNGDGVQNKTTPYFDANGADEQNTTARSVDVSNNLYHTQAGGKQDKTGMGGSLPNKNNVKDTSGKQQKQNVDDAHNPKWTFLSEQLADIGRVVWKWGLKPAVTVVLIYMIFYIGYIKVVCGHLCYMPLVCMFCPSQESTFVSLPPLHMLAEKSASLADTLISTDTSVTLHCVRAKTALIDTRAQVEYSEVDPVVKNELQVQLRELQDLIDTATDQLTVMLASFSGTLDNLHIYTQFALRDLQKWKNGKIYSQSVAQTDYGEPGATQMDIVTASFDRYVSSTDQQVNSVLEKAELAHMTLEIVIEKLSTIQYLNNQGKQISETRLKQLQNGSFWSRLFDEGQMGIEKHRRNLQILDGFIVFVKRVSINVGDVIVKLKSFKHDAKYLKETIASLDQSQLLSIDMQSELLEAALNRLSQSKTIFMNKINHPHQSQSNSPSNETGMENDL